MVLTEEELNFLEKHGFDANDVLDGRYLSKAEIKTRSDKSFYVGKKGCNKKGHRLRTRSGGHCVQCDTSKISYQKRFTAKEYVYLAASKKRGWIKVGTTKDINDREATLNKDRYASVDDWKILLYFISEKSGRVEREIQRKLGSYASAQSFHKGGKKRDTREVFTCSFATAYKALNYVGGIVSLEPEKPWKHPDAEHYADFQDIKGDGFVL
jgi:hypothetical protein